MSDDSGINVEQRKYQPQTSEPTEVCVKCGEELPVSDFVVCPCGKRVCKDCGEKVSNRTNAVMIEGDQ